MAAPSDSPVIGSYSRRLAVLQSPSNEEKTNSTMITSSNIDQCLQPNSLVSALIDPTYRLPKLDENYHEFSKKMLKNKVLLVPTRLALKRNRGSLQRLTRQSQATEFESLQMVLATQPFVNETLIDSWPKEMGDMNSQRLNVSPVQYYSSIPSNLSVRLRHNTAPTDVSLVFKEKPVSVHPVTGEILHHFVEDLGNPSPCSYVLPRKSLRAKNAPAFTFGERCLVEKTGGSRTAWDKQWFAHSNPFTTKVDFNRESVWPTPAHYPAPPALGIQATKLSFPAWSIGTRHAHDPAAPKDKTPSPNTYDTIPAFHKLTDKTSQITMKSRPGGTKVSNKLNTDVMPGPGAHDQRHFLSNKASAPKYSFGKRWPISLGQDPYISTLPSIES